MRSSEHSSEVFADFPESKTVRTGSFFDVEKNK